MWQLRHSQRGELGLKISAWYCRSLSAEAWVDAAHSAWICWWQTSQSEALTPPTPCTSCNRGSTKAKVWSAVKRLDSGVGVGSAVGAAAGRRAPAGAELQAAASSPNSGSHGEVVGHLGGAAMACQVSTRWEAQRSPFLCPRSGKAFGTLIPV
jgi:hypothetical protein